MSTTPPLPPRKHSFGTLQGTRTHICSPIWDMVLHMTSATARSGAVQTEEKGQFPSILDMSRWDTLGESLQTSWHQLSWVASEGGLGIGLSEFSLAPPSQPPEV